MATEYTQLGKEVAPTSVTKELRLLWDADDASTKASLMNFVIYSEQKGSILKNHDLVTEITREHACRAILMELNREGETPGLQAWITAQCNIAGGKKAVCCEQLSFLIHGYTSGIVRNTLFANLDSDLPLVLWWQGDFSTSFRESLYSKVDRVIFDSSDWNNLNVEYQKIVEAITECPNLVVQDIAWTRTFQFRIAVASLADHPVVVQRLNQLKSVNVVTSKEARTSGMLILAWVATVLKLQLSEDLVRIESDQFTMSRPDGGEVTLQSQHDSTRKALGKVTFDFGDVVLLVEAEPSNGLLLQQLILNGEIILSSHIPADKENLDDLLISQLSRGGKNSLFKRVLPTFTKLIDA